VLEGFIRKFEIHIFENIHKAAAEPIQCKHIPIETLCSNRKMSTLEGHEDFRQEDIETVMKNAIASTLGDVMYDHHKVNDWSNNIINSALKGLQSLNRPFKYVITVIIMQKNGAGLVSSASMFWDVKRDGFGKVTWENSTLHCIATIYGLSLNLDPVPETIEE